MLLPVHNVSNVMSNEFNASVAQLRRTLRLVLPMLDAWLDSFMFGTNLLLSNF